MKYRTTVIILSDKNYQYVQRTIETSFYDEEIVSISTSTCPDIEDAECIHTLDQDFAELVELEEAIAKEFGFNCPQDQIREEIVKMIKDGNLVENELIANWHDLYASYIHEVKRELDRHMHLHPSLDKQNI